MAATGRSALNVPFHRQYALYYGRGAYGPTLQLTTPTTNWLRMKAAETNMNYCGSRDLQLGLMFSRGGFLTPSHETNPNEKTLWAVPLYKLKIIHHQHGETWDGLSAKLAAT
jgi:hypothetical protein